MRSIQTVRFISAVFAAGFVAGCCGFLTDGSQAEREKPGESNQPTESVRQKSFAGRYEMESEEYEDLSLVIKKKRGYYTLEWGVPASEPWTATGVELDGYLCASTGGEEGVVGIYERKGSGISGLWLVDGGNYINDLSKDAEPLETSSVDFSGSYLMTADYADAGESYSYKLIIKSNGGKHAATEEFEDGGIVSVYALAVDRIIIMGFPVGGSLVTKAFKKSGARLEGKFFYSYYDEESGREEVVTGEESGEKE
ncbi:hypothetical protein GX441_12735 [bacterium]|nr:hypothetical protein [bacterium]